MVIRQWIEWLFIKLRSTSDPPPPHIHHLQHMSTPWHGPNSREALSSLLPGQRAITSSPYGDTNLAWPGLPLPQALGGTRTSWTKWADHNSVGHSIIRWVFRPRTLLLEKNYLWNVVIVNRSIEIRALLLPWLLQTIANLEMGKLKIVILSVREMQDAKPGYAMWYNFVKCMCMSVCV